LNAGNRTLTVLAGYCKFLTPPYENMATLPKFNICLYLRDFSRPIEPKVKLFFNHFVWYIDIIDRWILVCYCRVFLVSNFDNMVNISDVTEERAVSNPEEGSNKFLRSVGNFYHRNRTRHSEPSAMNANRHENLNPHSSLFHLATLSELHGL